ncbi:glycosyltransferase [Candidatus Micrarchaeota archaeon]|nr:glycosyltransferase [Candidatus Micrarchaeota archaeon]
MKIAFFTDTYLPNVDGVVRAIVNYRGELQRRGHDVFVYTSGTGDESRNNTEKSVVFFRSVKFPPYPQYKVALFPYVSAILSARKQKIDLVHSHGVASMGFAAVRTAKTLNLPLVGTFHTLLPKGMETVTKNKWGQRTGEKLLWKAIQYFYQPFDVVTAPSNVISQMLIEHLECERGKVMAVPNGIDLQRFNQRLDPKWARKPLGLRKGEKLVLVAGRMGFEKNVPVVVKAFSQVLKAGNAKLVISGEGPAKARVLEFVRKSGLQDRVEMLGFLPEQELPLYYAAADVFVTASTFETQGLTVLESMACGTPVVGARAMAIPESIDDGKNGFLFEPSDDGECAEKILKILSMNDSKRRRMREEARAKAEQFSIPKTTDKLLKAYERTGEFHK